MSSVWFDYTEPFVTTSSHGNKICRGISHEFVWFDYTEYSVTTSSQGKDM